MIEKITIEQELKAHLVHKVSKAHLVHKGTPGSAGANGATGPQGPPGDIRVNNTNLYRVVGEGINNNLSFSDAACDDDVVFEGGYFIGS